MKKLAIFIALICLTLGVQAQTTQSGLTYKMVEQMPTFPGGDAALMKHIDSHIQFPKEAADWNFDDLVVVQFVVTKTGQVGEVKVVRSLIKEFEQEAIRLCKSLPKFIPGRQNGQPVDMWYTLPIRFRIKPPKTDNQ